MNRCLPVTFSLFIAACANQAPEQDGIESYQASAPVQESQPAIDEEPRAGNLVATETLADEAPDIEELETPTLDQIPAELIPGKAEPEVVCERSVPTGSIMPVKVCRAVSDIEQQQTDDRKLIDNIKRNTANAASRL